MSKSKTSEWVREQLRESGETQARFAALVGISVDRLKRLMGTKASNPRDGLERGAPEPSAIERNAIERAVYEVKRDAIRGRVESEGVLIRRVREEANAYTTGDREEWWDGTLIVSRHRCSWSADDEAESITKTLESGRVDGRSYIAGYTGYYPSPVLIVIWPEDS